MAPISSYDKIWRRGGRLNQKRHYEMTDEEKARVARCDGIKHEHKCKDPVFRCSKCGNYGCDQVVPEKCSIQGFKNGKCLHCGTMETRIPVIEDEIPDIREIWEREVATIGK